MRGCPSWCVRQAIIATRCTVVSSSLLSRKLSFPAGILNFRLSFPAGILNFRSTCGVCDSWALVRDGICHGEWSGGDGCLLGEVGDRGLVGAVCLAQG